MSKSLFIYVLCYIQRANFRTIIVIIIISVIIVYCIMMFSFLLFFEQLPHTQMFIK